MTGLRPGEARNARVDGDMLIIKPIKDKAGNVVWRPKTLSSHRRVPRPTGWELTTIGVREERKQVRALISDKNVTPHSGRHTFIELARRAGADLRIIDEVCGHGSKQGSSSQRGYGAFPDEVLTRETKKVWELITHIVNPT